ncbi:DUF262 domain-containing protein [Streptococcus sp. IsoGale021]|uniref:GmrSD restriction endonuclease domain-containing protein n=1 Tax=Streptococcus TaxID=1301 RepID=UPI002284BDC4|nr:MULTISPECIES: DUF1524 domain-containing protein [Streptococcus]MDQ8694373.1 DUF262 domain-containing protein [Streptococcus sp. IsoGale021]MDU5127728.1 DUF262 domain-containing protein [Streptococcus anginosus]MEE0847050.1 DUF262 domain-containing protein [Streptococcus anginosus]
MLSVLTNKFKNIKEEDLAEATFEYIKTKDDYGRPIPKLKSITSYPYFEAYVQSIEKTDVEPVTEEEINIKQTYNYFESELEEMKLKGKYDFNENTLYKDLLIAIRDQILQMNVISILTEEKDSAYEIFEILNAKGKNLASIDLIKNSIYSKFHADDNAKDKIIENKWEGIKTTLRSRNPNIGFATFYRHYWISKYQKTTNSKLYDSFKKHIKSNKKSYEEFVEDLSTIAETYMKIVSPNIDDYDNRKECNWLIQSLKAIEKTFGVTQARIALLALFELKSNDKISSKAFKDAVNYIENFIFAYTGVLKNQANIYESRFSKLAIKLRESENKSDTNNILKEYLYQEFEDRYPQKEEFLSGFVRLRFSKEESPTNTITKYVLNKISSKLNNSEVYSIDSSIEHIINEDISNDNTLFIGNLICLEIDLNNEASDLAYEEKLEVYKKSKYNQIRIFCNNYPNFNENDIEERSKILGEYYYDNILNKSN